MPLSLLMWWTVQNWTESKILKNCSERSQWDGPYHCHAQSQWCQNKLQHPLCKYSIFWFDFGSKCYPQNRLHDNWLLQHIQKWRIVCHLWFLLQLDSSAGLCVWLASNSHLWGRCGHCEVEVRPVHPVEELHTFQKEASDGLGSIHSWLWMDLWVNLLVF